MRTRLEYRGESLPVMGCNFTASIHPPAPPFAGPEYDAWKNKLGESPEMLITLEIAFPRYYWRAQYIQQGNKPFYIVDFPAIGNVAQLKECVFLNNVDMRLPNGTVIRGFPCDDMKAAAIEKNTAILVQEGLAIGGNAELLAIIAQMNLEIKRIHEEHFNMLNGIKISVAEMRLDHGQHAETLGRVESTQQEMKPHVEGVPKLVEDSKQTTRQAMADFYRVIYAPGMSAKQKAIADAMREAKNIVREASKILKADKAWKSESVSPSTICRELEKMDALFRVAQMPNPFEGRENNRARPVVKTTYTVRKVDPNNPNSAKEFIPIRPEGYRADETEDETP